MNFVYLMSRHFWDTSLPKSPNSRKNLHSLTQLCQQIFLFICSYQTSIRIILINSLNQLKTTAQISVLNRLSLLAYKSENTIIVKVWKVQCLKNCYHWLKKVDKVRFFFGLLISSQFTHYGCWDDLSASILKSKSL